LLLQVTNKCFDKLEMWMSAQGCCSGQLPPHPTWREFSLCSALQALAPYH
jgi:hypothetical protein